MADKQPNSVNRIRSDPKRHTRSKKPLIWQGDIDEFLDALTERGWFDLVITSPPYNLGKVYEDKQKPEAYLKNQERIITKIAERTKDGGSICWQTGNYVENGEITPLDIELHRIFRDLGLRLRNRIIWRFGHGLHNQRRFSGRYEVIMWYTKGEEYTFNLDAVRQPQKYPAKKAYRGTSKGHFSSNPLGKNPEDVWDFDLDVWQIPNVKGNHIEKTNHPCQFPVGLVKRLVLALSNEGDLVFDPFLGAGSTGIAAVDSKRRFWGCEILENYATMAKERIELALSGDLKFRPHDKLVYDHRQSRLSVAPEGFEKR